MKPKNATAKALLSTFVLLLLLLSGRHAVADVAVEPQGTAAVDELMRQLGHVEYSVRDEAAGQLASLGLEVRDELTAGLQAVDPEVRRRCRRILVRVAEADYQRRIAAMLADRTGGDHDLPGWAWYRRVIGNDEDARKMFAAMLQAEPGLFASAEQGPEHAEEAFKLRFAQLYQQQVFPNQQLRRQPGTENVAALLFVAVNPEWRLPGQLVDNPHLINFTRSGEFAALLGRETPKAPVRRLIGRWLLIQGTPNMVQQKLRMALQYQIPEGLPLALGMLEKPEAQPPNMVAFTAEAVARLGGKPYAATLMPLLDDERQCARSGNRVIEVRDVALAWLVQATGQDIEAYGQPTAKSWFEVLAQNPAVMFNFSQFGYEDIEHRADALKRWADWVEANPLPTPPEVQDVLVADRPAGQPAVVPPEAEPSQSAFGGLNLADRSLIRRLREAERLAALGEFSSSARELGLLLASDSDFFFRPERDVPLYRHLKSVAENVLGLLPDEGRAAYELLYGSESRHLLDEALAGSDRQKLARVSQDYFHTEAGAEATYLLGASYWQSGQLFSAAACWQRLADSGHRARSFEPALSLQLAACWLAMGEPWRIPTRLEQLKAQFAGTPVHVAGRRKDWFADAGDAQPWLVALLGHQLLPTEALWGLFRGHPSRNPLAEGGSPYLVAEPLDTNEQGTLFQTALNRVRNDYFGRRRVALPTLYPLVVDNTIVLRTATRIRAVHAQSGELLWEAAPDDALTDLLDGPDAGKDEVTKELLPIDLLSRLYQNLAYSAISSDGRFVFAVEGLPLQGMIGPQRMVVRADGTRRLDCGALGKDSVLAAYDLSNGKLRWEAGGPFDGDKHALAGAYFLGPPLPLGASLYCLADVGDQTVLLVLDAATGALQWQRVLAVREEPDSRMAIQMPGFVIQRTPAPPRANGASPSYADGILVCLIADEQVVAVDLTSRSATWLYEGQGDLSDEPLAARRRQMAQAQTRASRPPTDQWMDTCVITAEERVLLTPAGTDQLICLRLADGMEQWTAPRADGLYVGAVHEGIVLVVGRSGVRGLRLADGESAWPDELSLPPGAMPSGRGFLSGGRLYIPLSTAEVLGIDAASGRLVSRSRSPAGIVPGNLVGLGDRVVSQNVDGLWRFDLIAQREALAARRLEQAPDDGAAWAERGELLLCDGRIAEAIECLTRARELAPTEASRLQLVRAVTDGLWTDYAQFRPLAESLALEEIDPGQRASILWAMGSGAQRAGDRTTALDTFLTLAQIDPVAEATEPLSTAVTVRRDRWLAARLDELLNNAGPEDRTRAADRLASLSKEAQVRYLPFQAATIDARVQLGADLAQSENTLAAEQQLRAALWFSQPNAAPEAVARLAEFLRLQGRPREASRLYERLDGPMAGQICLDGQTGRQLVDALAAEHPARPNSAVRPLWPPDSLEATAEKPDGQQATVSHVPVRVRAVDTQFDRPANVRVEQVGRSLFGYDDLGRQTWEIPLKQRTPNIGFRNGYYMAEGAQLGQVLVVWLVTRVCAIDLSGETPRLLWDHETTELGGNDPRQQYRLQRANQRRLQLQRGGVTGGDSSPLVVAHGYVCFERNEELVAVDLLSGDILWTRDDVPEQMDLFGDARYVFVVPAEGTGDARVFSALDGQELGQRTLPSRSDCMAAIGRRLLVWKTDARQCQLRLIDAWTGEVAWEREMPAETQVCLVRHEGVAALDPEGWFAVWRIESGEPLVETKLEVQPTLEQIHVEHYGENFLILANRPPEPTAPRIFIHNATPAVNVNGSLYCVGSDGRTLWSTEVMDQQLELDLPSELPVLLFSKRRQSQVPRPEGGVTTKVEYAILCLDKRSGRTLHDETLETHGQEIEVRTVDPKDGLIEVITRPLTIKLTRVKDSP